jgi:hypothetical protein
LAHEVLEDFVYAIACTGLVVLDFVLFFTRKGVQIN